MRRTPIIRIKKSIFRWGILGGYAVVLGITGYVFAGRLPSLGCTSAGWAVIVARAAGQNCHTQCTNWEAVATVLRVKL
jgi:hypothetical protein